MDDVAGLFMGGFLIGILFGAAIFGPIAGCQQMKEYQQEAIEHNAAEYDATTGEWRWKEPKKASPQ